MSASRYLRGGIADLRSPIRPLGRDRRRGVRNWGCVDWFGGCIVGGHACCGGTGGPSYGPKKNCPGWLYRDGENGRLDMFSPADGGVLCAPGPPPDPATEALMFDI